MAFGRCIDVPPLIIDILETMLSKFPILHQGLIFQLKIFDNTYNFEVIETSTKEFPYECIDIIDTENMLQKICSSKPDFTTLRFLNLS